MRCIYIVLDRTDIVLWKWFDKYSYRLFSMKFKTFLVRKIDKNIFSVLHKILNKSEIIQPLREHRNNTKKTKYF